MNIADTTKVLSLIQAFHDKFDVSESRILAWHALLKDHQLSDCLQAVQEHYRNSTAWIMPAHVVERVREVEQRRIDKLGGFLHLSPKDEERYELGSPAWRAATRTLHQAAKHGNLSADQYRSYQDGNLSLDSLHNTTKEISQ